MTEIRPRRSVLYMPGSNARALDKARSLDVDAVIMDLEDAVAPEAKETARAQICEALARGGYGERECVVRVNGLDTPWGADDVAAAARSGAGAMLFPKISDAGDVEDAAVLMARRGAPADMALWIMAETPRAIQNIHAICAASARLACVVMGTADLAKALRLPADPERPALVPLLSQCLVAARATGLDILDGVFTDLGDDAGFRASCQQGRRLGFDGKTLVHPRQAAPANEIFGVPAAELAEARAIIAAWDAAQARGDGITVLNGRMIERLHADAARRTVALAGAIARRMNKEEE